MMHFPPVSDFTPISEKFSDFLNFFTILPFPVFLVIDHKFRISPYFRCFSTFPPCFAKIFLSPYFSKFSRPVLGKFTCFLHTLRVFPPTLTMMHLCITQCTYWTPLISGLFSQFWANCNALLGYYNRNRFIWVEP